MKRIVVSSNFSSITILLVISFSLSSALTTFGKTNQQTPPPSQTARVPAFDLVTSRSALEFGRLTSSGRSGGRPGTKSGGVIHSFGKGRECKVESDCIAQPNTTCIADPRDSKTLRCLCGDYSAPYNGACNNKYKAVGAPCNDHEECGDGGQCIKNDTGSGKRCQCKEGFYEDNFQCNGSDSLFNLSSTLLMSFALLLLKSFTS